MDASQPTGRGSYAGKRLVDLGLVALLAAPAFLLALLSALAIVLTSRGPVLFRQERIGLDGQPFQLVKFRTMIVGDNPVFPDATKITRIGRLLRGCPSTRSRSS